MSETFVKSPSCSVFSCLKPTKAEQNAYRPVPIRIGVGHEMRAIHNQPHLIEPMRLTVYDAMPTTPLAAAAMTIRASETWRTVSKTSTRISLSVRKRSIRKLALPRPRPAAAHPHQPPLPKGLSFTPIQLSFHGERRLSDLSGFDDISFTEAGEIREPPKVLLRSQSEALLQTYISGSEHSQPNEFPSMENPSTSNRTSVLAHSRNNTISSVPTTSRPVSSHDALRSHPVSWYAVPGLPLQMVMAERPAGHSTLSPLQECFTPPPGNAVLINGRVLAFPDISAHRTAKHIGHASSLPSAPGGSTVVEPLPIVNPAHKKTTVTTVHHQQPSQSGSILLASSAASTKTRGNIVPRDQSNDTMARPQLHYGLDTATTNIQSWLEGEELDHGVKSRSSSVHTIKTSNSFSTTSSFVEHRQKRMEFYQLNKKPVEDAAAVTPVDASKSTSSVPKTPSSIKIYKPFPIGIAVRSEPFSAIHTRARTASSTYSTRTAPRIQTQPGTYVHQHYRTATDSTISTIASDVLFEDPETPEDIQNIQSFADKRVRTVKDSDAGSMTTYNNSAFNSRSSTMRSTHSQVIKPFARQTGHDSEKSYDDYCVHKLVSVNHAASSPSLSLSDELSKEIQVSSNHAQRPQSFNFRQPTPNPVISAATWNQVDDVERYMHEICASAGLRRVNVGVAF